MGIRNLSLFDHAEIVIQASRMVVEFTLSPVLSFTSGLGAKLRFHFEANLLAPERRGFRAARPASLKDP
jgi:hypothetical protein